MVRLGILNIPAGITALNKLWSRGGYPASFHTSTDAESLRIRSDLIEDCLEELASRLGSGIQRDSLERLLAILARGQGSMFTPWRVADRLQLSLTDLKSCIKELADLPMLRVLPPYGAAAGEQLLEHSKLYLRDSGLMHALLGIRDHTQLSGRSVAGPSWEGFVVENLLSLAPDGARAGYYRNEAGAEMDLVLDLPGDGIWAIEIKRNIKTRLKKSFHDARADIQPDRCYFVHAGQERMKVMNGVEGIGLEAMARIIRNTFYRSGS
jgi:predicted AAA+ superfamily ATPase